MACIVPPAAAMPLTRERVNGRGSPRRQDVIACRGILRKTVRKKRSRPTQDEASRLTENLITVAGKMFEEEFSAVSMNRIAATAGMGKDTL